MFIRRRRWRVPAGQQPTELDRKIMAFENKGAIVPKRSLIRTPEEIEGIKRSGVINTAILDLVGEKIHAGMSTLEINELVHNYTIEHGAVPACLGYEGFPKSVCTSINEVVCHGIPSAKEILKEGDIINVDCTTILDGYYADASRMYVIGKTSTRKQKLVDVAKECLYMNRFIFESDRACLDTTRMDRRAFCILCTMLREHGNLRRTKNTDIEEMVAMFLIIISHDEKNRIMRRLYARSTETISRQFNLVLNAVLRLQGILLKTPDPVPENSTDERWKWFKVTINVFGIYYIFTSFILMKFTYNLICLKELLRSTGWNLYQGQCACSR